MPESRKVDREGTADRPTDRRPVSAVKLPAALTERIDSWALGQAINRSEAIERLIELGLKSQVTTSAAAVPRREAGPVEELIASQIEQLIDPSTPKEERDRRIRRLTEGPPEFVSLRIDLPKRGP
jgi:hypothetical protein